MKRIAKKQIWGTNVSDPLFRKSGRQYYVCRFCKRIYTYLGIDRHERSCPERKSHDR